MAIVCDDANPCTNDSCIGGNCLNTAINCDDGNACTNDTCIGGNCRNIAVNCDDGDTCTIDGCDVASGCFYIFDTVLCGIDPCDSLICNDNDACTLDTCVGSGQCQFTAITCDDANACTSDSCVSGSCVFAPVICDDSNACTEDSCVGGQCQFTAIVCDDTNACTNDLCVNGNCVFTAMICDDSNACTVDSCVGGQCQFIAIVCDDANACTSDSCVNGSCVFTPIVCDDSDACTHDSCVNGQCEFTAIVCDDANACTIETCDSTDGCVITPVSIEITIVHIPPVDSINRGSSITLSASSNPAGLSYSWTPSLGLSCDDCLNPIAKPDTTTEYFLEATDANGCSGNAGTLIVVIGDTSKPNDCPDYIYVPNAFSPNGDGVNDVFYVYGNVNGILDMHLRIFNRWGEFIFESFSLNDGWDGTYKGKLQDPGVFVYYLSVTFCDGSMLSENSEYHKGSVTLLR